MTRDHAAFAWWFGLRHQQAAMLEVLFIAAGGPCRLEPRAAAKITICRIREAMSEEAIDTTEAGYNLTEAGMAECDRALAEFGAWATGRAA